MIKTCFNQKPNVRKRTPKAKPVASPVPGTTFEARAFNALLKNRQRLGIKCLWRCNSARLDGYIETIDGEVILLEMKECLGWGAFQAASAEFMMGRQLLGLSTRRGVIVFEKTSNEWDAISPHGAWGQLALHSSELAPYLEIGGLQVLPNGEFKFSALDSQSGCHE